VSDGGGARAYNVVVSVALYIKWESGGSCSDATARMIYNFTHLIISQESQKAGERASARKTSSAGEASAMQLEFI